MKVLVVVFIPSDSPDIYQAVSHALAPFDCEKEVEEYEKPCGCIESGAWLDAHDYAREVSGKDESINERFEQKQAVADARRHHLIRLAEKRELTPGEREELDQFWEKFHQTWVEAHEPYKQAFHDALTRYSVRARPDPNCDICAGSGKEMSDCNPQARWSRWSIGWNGYFDTSAPPGPAPAHPPQVEPNLFKRLAKWWNASDEDSGHKREYESEVIGVRDIPADWPLPYAAVADGQWYQRCESEELPLKERTLAEEAWQKLYKGLLAKHKNDLAVACRVAV